MSNAELEKTKREAYLQSRGWTRNRNESVDQWHHPRLGSCATTQAERYQLSEDVRGLVFVLGNINNLGAIGGELRGLVAELLVDAMVGVVKRGG